MKKLCVLGLALTLLMGSVVSSVSAAPYVSGNFGMVSMNDSTLSGDRSGEMSMDSGFGFNAAVGNNFDGLRGEVEGAYRTNDLDEISSIPAKGDITSVAVMGNLLFDLDISERLRPFLGAGMGLTNVKIDGASGSSDDTVFAYQAIAGIGFPLTHVTTLDLQYRYFAGTNPDFDGTEAEYQTHNFFAGLRFDF